MQQNGMKHCGAFPSASSACASNFPEVTGRARLNERSTLRYLLEARRSVSSWPAAHRICNPMF